MEPTRQAEVVAVVAIKQEVAIGRGAFRAPRYGALRRQLIYAQRAARDAKTARLRELRDAEEQEALRLCLGVVAVAPA